MDDNLQVLQKLDAARGDIQRKLEKIEEKKATVSQEVYEKVRCEYERKLKELDDQLAQNRELVEAAVQRIKQEQASLSEKERDLRLKLEEVNLRYTIGEYDDATYRETEQEHSHALQAVMNSLQNLDERLRWLSGFARSEEATVAPVRPEPAPVVEPSEPAASAATSGIEIDEHILESKVSGEEVKLDDLLSTDMTLVEEPGSVPPAKPEVSNEPKGVVCPKCGATNVPDAWYCEKCGAEILDTGS